MTYLYIVKQKGLNNLLWCWSPAVNVHDFNQYYRGDEYVDVVGLDAYTSNLAEVAKDDYNKILKYAKPFGISEYGCVDGGASESKPFDYSIFLNWLENTNLLSCITVGRKGHFYKNAMENIF